MGVFHIFTMTPLLLQMTSWKKVYTKSIILLSDSSTGLQTLEGLSCGSLSWLLKRTGSWSHFLARLFKSAVSSIQSSPWMPALQGLLMMSVLFWDKKSSASSSPETYSKVSSKSLVTFYMMKAAKDLSCFLTYYNKLCFTVWGELQIRLSTCHHVVTNTTVLPQILLILDCSHLLQICSENLTSALLVFTH